MPGLFWKPASVRLRQAAAPHYDDEKSAYRPVGKSMRVLGGVGTVRLLPFSTGRLLCATQGHHAWEGIPVFAPRELWDELGEPVVVNLEGRWVAMERDVAGALHEEVGLPRFCLVVEPGDVEVMANGSITAAAWSLMEMARPNGALDYAFTYSTFTTEERGLARAIEFMADYGAEHGGRFLTEFDETQPRLRAEVRLSWLLRDAEDRRLGEVLARIQREALAPGIVDYGALRDVIVRFFDEEEIRFLAMDAIGFELANVVGSAAGRLCAAKALVDHCEARALLAPLVAKVIDERPAAAALLAR